MKNTYPNFAHPYFHQQNLITKGFQNTHTMDGLNNHPPALPLATTNTMPISQNQNPISNTQPKNK